MGSPVITGDLLLKAILLLSFQTSALLSSTEAKRTLSKDEYLSMKRHLKSLNKPAVKSIETDYGNIFDCVDINKQPAFDHPLLKNDTIQMKPGSHPQRKGDKISSSSLHIGLPGDGCPVGTVPIRRVTMEDLMRAPSLSQFGKKYAQNDSQLILSDFSTVTKFHHWATIEPYRGEYYGTQATMNVWQPDVSGDKFSLAQFWLTSGPNNDQLNSIEAGWTVNPIRLKDNKVRLFAYWTADGYQKTGCYNLECPGFVQVNKKVPLGAYFNKVSTFGGVQKEITLLAFLDLKTNNWWLKYGDELVGYWPNKLFTSLSTKAEIVQWGGEVFNPDGLMPPMGSAKSNILHSSHSYLSMKRHLKSLNKPAVKSIETGYGNIFDCVDINKQPAFDHPLLKNDTIQMKPGSHPQRKGTDKISSSSVHNIGLPGDGCPLGTVPIRRVTMEDLMRAPSLSQFGQKYSLNDSRSILSGVNVTNFHHWAAIQANRGEFYGTQATMNVWQPDVSGDKFSLAQFWLTSGPYDQQNSIEAGWTVNPSRYNDNQVHLFAYWTADGYQNTGCYDHDCPGFVQFSNKVPLGAYFNKVSTFGGVQQEITLLTFLDDKTNWWLKYGDEFVGYWPNKLFTSLSTKAENVHWGGQVLNPDGLMPPMGSGRFAEEDFGKACYMKNVMVLTEDRQFADAPKQTALYLDAPKCYSIIDKGTQRNNWRRTFYFGGPGGNCI
ncbi:hypothetical protein H6P81_020996 [Aristolochia fimbriata]|uniref:Neprosin PEP catalytic domain-containing protein n=1 Tax=Aristolochia fimbriata TaxID=158543 RepID=A0AAV7DZ06_ARIFI|nr:hypothetical protein H6P81_020996 [Aristolochia fimbriata]